MQKFLTMIEKDLQSDNAADCAYAIRACCIQHISNDKIIAILKTLKSDNRIAMMNKISDSAMAALDILGIEKYTGDNPAIIEIIKTVYYRESTV